MSYGRLGHYDLESRLGRGGMGVVFKAWDSRLRRHVALKILQPFLATASHGHIRLLREASAEAALNHDNIATVFSFEQEPLTSPGLVEALGYEHPAPDTVEFMTMEFVEGEDLGTRIASGPLSVAEALDIALQVADALECAHEAGVVHRDLKTLNIRITPKGKVKILDFGLAQWQETVTVKVGEEPTLPPSSLLAAGGTPGYMAPEQAWGGAVDARSDLFSFGVVIYKMLTGQLPYPGRNANEVQEAIRSSNPRPMSEHVEEIPPDLEQIVGRLLACSPADRYQSASAVGTDLAAVARGETPSFTDGQDVDDGSGIPWMKIALVVASVVALGIGVLILQKLWPPDHPEIQNLAVRPFDYAGDPEFAFVAQGFAPSIVTDLSQLEGLNVVSLSSVTDADPIPLAKLAESFDVGSVLEGLVQLLDEDLQIDVSLVGTSDSKILWSHRYQSTVKDHFRVQVDVAEGVARALSIELSPRLREQIDRVPTGSLDAYRLYVQARRSLEHRADPGAATTAVAALRDCLALDPDFALALAALSNGLQYAYLQNHELATLEEAEEVARRSVALEPDLLDGRLALARVYNKTGRYELAKNELDRILQLKSDHDAAFAELHKAWRGLGNLEESEQALLQAVRIRSDFWEHWVLLGNFYKETGAYDQARMAYESAIDVAPDGETWPYENLASIEMLEGNFQRAKAVYDRIPPQYMSASLASGIAYYFYARGQYEHALTYYQRSAELEPNVSDWQYNLGDGYWVLGDSVRARTAYKKAAQLATIEMEHNPASLINQLWRLVFVCKSGDCETAQRELESLQDQLTLTADAAFVVAVIHACCEDDEAAIEWIEQALELGFPRESLRQEPAFLSLLEHPVLVGDLDRDSGDDP